MLGHDMVCRLSKGAVQDLAGVVLALTTQSRQENALLKLTSRERREMKAKLAAEKQAALEKAAKAAAGRAAPHPATQEHAQLNKLLNRYHVHELFERQKAEGPAADQKAL